MDGSPPGSPVPGILQARILEWVAMPSSRGSSRPRDEPASPALQADSLLSEPPGKQWNERLTVMLTSTQRAHPSPSVPLGQSLPLQIRGHLCLFGNEAETAYGSAFPGLFSLFLQSGTRHRQQLLLSSCPCRCRAVSPLAVSSPSAHCDPPKMSKS